jgi:NAD(P)-dependent dehydrogenase (short-subunit alcohol dehydrogenase family)
MIRKPGADRQDPHLKLNKMSTQTQQPSTFPLSDAVVMITGALTGIGQATALAFANEGSRVVVSGRRKKEGFEFAAKLRGMGKTAEFIYADVTREGDLKSLIEQTIAKFGRLDIAVNNAGTEGTPGPVTDQTPESYAAIFDTNVLGVLLSMKHELLVMKAQGHGNIINVSSTLGIQGGAGASVYSASKHAVEGLTKSAALEVAATGIRINAVAPGPIDTDMLTRFAGNDDSKGRTKAKVPAQRFGRPEEVANAIVFLASDKSPFLTGQSIVIDGGKTA